MSTVAPPPPYAYVFRKLPHPPLQREDDDMDIAKLHIRYWGKSIDQDESTWVGMHGELAEDDPDGSEVVRGCFALTDIPANDCIVGRSQIWVRKDYLQIYDSCNNHCQHALDEETLSPIAVITGQPGVGECFSSMSFSFSNTLIQTGKTLWIFYAMCRRLGESKPFLWYHSKRWYLFAEGGVFECPKPLDTAFFTPYLWAFVDSSDSPPSDPVPEVTLCPTNLFVIVGSAICSYFT